MNATSAAFLAGVLSASTFPANAFLVYGTGLDNAGNIATLGAPDLHYSLADPFSASATAYTTGNSQHLYVHPVSDGKGSQWIQPDPYIYAVFDPGHWLYSTTFDLTGYDFSTANIVGQWASDNNAEIFLNGISTGFTTAYDAFSYYSDFSITTGFAPGLNTLVFDVYNGGVQTGLVVSIGSATANLAPEPGILFLFWTGLAGLVRFRFRE